jgi:hypothetical protein
MHNLSRVIPGRPAGPDPESIFPRMDSGLAASRRPGMTRNLHPHSGSAVRRSMTLSLLRDTTA